MTRTGTVADVIKELKRASSVWIKSEFPDLADFSWQSGYGVFSFDASRESAARTCIAAQEAHYRKASFQEEFRKLLKKYGIAYDERFTCGTDSNLSRLEACGRRTRVASQARQPFAG